MGIQEIEAEPLMPAWVRDVFNQALDQFESIDRVLAMSMAGIGNLTVGPRMAEYFAKWQPESTSEERVESARAAGALASAEVEDDFPVLHAQAVVALVGAFEAMVKDFLIAWLTHHPEAFQQEPISRLRVRVGDVVGVDEDERSTRVVELLEQELGVPLRDGVTRYEAVLAPFGFSGAVGDRTRRTLFEVTQIRNVLVHRRGRADRRLTESCPWLGLAVGDGVTINHASYVAYSKALNAYVFEIVQRVGGAFGLDREKDPPE